MISSMTEPFSKQKCFRCLLESHLISFMQTPYATHVFDLRLFKKLIMCIRIKEGAVCTEVFADLIFSI